MQMAYPDLTLINSGIWSAVIHLGNSILTSGLVYNDAGLSDHC